MSSSEVSTSLLNRPRRYQIRQEFFKLGNSYNIKDEFGRDKYIVKSGKWTLQKRLVLENMDGK